MSLAYADSREGPDAIPLKQVIAALGVKCKYDQCAIYL